MKIVTITPIGYAKYPNRFVLTDTWFLKSYRKTAFRDRAATHGAILGYCFDASSPEGTLNNLLNYLMGETKRPSESRKIGRGRP